MERLIGDNNKATTNSTNKAAIALSKLYNSTLGLLNA